MRVAALYDIHGNLPALEAVLEEIRQVGVDLIVVGGDVVPGPMPHETIASLRNFNLPIRFISGNGEREVLAQRKGITSGEVPLQYRETMQLVAQQITDGDAEFLSGWPETIQIDIDGLGEILFCHATPRSDTEIFTRLTPEDQLKPIFEKNANELVICGHTHMQFDRMIGTTRVVNAGSVGMPFGEAGAYWLLLDEGIHLKHTNYNLNRAAERIQNTSYPQANEFAANNILKPPTEQAMLEVFGYVKLK